VGGLFWVGRRVIAGSNGEDLTDDVLRRISLIVSVKKVREKFGFELNWSEIAGLRHYINCFWETHDNGFTDSPTIDAFHYFMVDYFGLDMLELGKCATRVNKNKRLWKSYGSGWLGEKSFKEYCRMNVNFWRDQRNLF